MIGSLQQIGKHTQTRYNSGYLTRVYLVPTTALLFVQEPDPATLLVPDGGVALGIGGEVTEIVCKPKTATLSDTMQTGDDVSYLTEVNIPILTEAPELTRWVNQNANRRWVVLVQDTLGNNYCIGTHQNGGRLGWGRQVAGRHVQSLVIRTSSLTPAAWMSTLDPEALLANREFDHSFDLSFS